ncbi:hypothetical protein [Lampropedia aestuarii]|uniref:bestrophin-like domain n=1 Tax=Lampropedia aestuarii TaxID=2562762 RepID=UPI001F1098BC|nr:hypothetical protein [Lampropedia aestuarii]MDH5856421.1 hypothetical protein [Lampropedia aestuarii]
MLQEFFGAIDGYSWIVLVCIFAGLSLAACLGKFSWGSRHQHDSSTAAELQIVLGATLSLFGLLVGFLVSVAINGYNSRVAAEENEATAIGNAFQHTSLLQERYQAPAEAMLQDYLRLRIAFFEASNDQQRAQLRLESMQVQTTMWEFISQLAQRQPDPVIAKALTVSSELYVSQQKTVASWRHQIPIAAWTILVIFGLCSNYLIGNNIRGKSGRNRLLFFMPAVTALTLFMIAEIDAPGKGVIHVTPENLKDILYMLEHRALMQ